MLRSRKYSAMLKRSGNCVISSSEKYREWGVGSGEWGVSNFFDLIPHSPLCQMRYSFHLDHRIGIEQAFNFEQGHRRIVTAKVRAMNFAQRLQLRAIGVAVGDVDVELDAVLHPPAGGLDHGLEIFDDLLVLGD